MIARARRLLLCDHGKQAPAQWLAIGAIRQHSVQPHIRRYTVAQASHRGKLPIQEVVMQCRPQRLNMSWLMRTPPCLSSLA